LKRRARCRPRSEPSAGGSIPEVVLERLGFEDTGILSEETKEHANKEALKLVPE